MNCEQPKILHQRLCSIFFEQVLKKNEIEIVKMYENCYDTLKLKFWSEMLNLKLVSPKNSLLSTLKKVEVMNSKCSNFMMLNFSQISNHIHSDLYMKLVAVLFIAVGKLTEIYQVNKSFRHFIYIFLT